MLPPILRTQSVVNINQIPLKDFGGSRIYLAHHQVMKIENDGKYLFFDGAGISEDADKARFLSMMESIERVSATSSSTISKNIFFLKDRRLQVPIKYFSPYDDPIVSYLDKCHSNFFNYSVYGRGIISNQSYILPAYLVFPKWRNIYQDFDLPIPESDGAGIASGFAWDRKAILYRALSEILERDAAMLFWRVKSRPSFVCLPKDITMKQASYLELNKLNLRLFDIADIGFPEVIAAVLSNENTENVTIGFSCGSENNAEKALNEALMLRTSAINLDKGVDKFNNEKITTSTHRLLFGWRNGQLINDVLNTLNIKNENVVRKTFTLEQLLNLCFTHFKHEPIEVDLTHPNLQGSSFKVLRVLLPNAFKKEYNHNYFYRGGSRLNDILLNERDFNTVPHVIA